MRREALVLSAVLALLVTTPAVGESRYGAWQGGAGGGSLEDLVAELRRLTREAEEARAADPRFLRDLKDLADRFHRPWPRELLFDDFRDGDYRRDPQWTVQGGVFRADPRRGLLLDTPAPAAAAPPPDRGEEGQGDPGAELAMALLGSLMDRNRDDRGEKAAPPARREQEEGLIHTRVAVPNAYALQARLAVAEAGGALEFGVFQGRPGGPGYRLALAPGDGGSVELLRVGSRGTAVVERARADVRGEVELQWTRGEDGRMRVELDGKALIDTVDRGFRDPFIGLQVRQQGGRYWLREVTLLGTPR